MDEFKRRLAEHAAEVTGFLEAQLETRASGGDIPSRLSEAMRHAVVAGGKRLRPFLVIESARLFGVPTATAIPVAAALECVHCYSLVHDDLPAMDNDRLRRGAPTVWVAYDEWTAILAGDGLLTLAFEVLSDRALIEIDAERRVDLTGKLAQASGWAGMVGGQQFDLEADKLGRPAAPDEAHVRRLQSMKTGALILYACEAGAILGAADEKERKALSDYGRALGLAFQIADDILDAEGDAAVLGKATGKDAAAGKATLIGVLGLEAARAELVRAHQAALDSLAPFGAAADVLRACARFVVQRDR